MYPVGLPFWKFFARLGVPIRLRVDVFYDAESKSYWAQSPDLDGLIVGGQTLDELHTEISTAASELLSIALHNHSARAETEIRFREKTICPA
jgi:predicted RNase H-like HicB family nuclease